MNLSKTTRAFVSSLALGVATLSLAPAGITEAAATQTQSVQPSGAVSHRTIDIDGINIFYREAGDPSKPTVLLLHGFPTSSQMFRNLIPQLSDRYHVIAPDYPGFGGSDQVGRETFDYTFDNLAGVMEKFLAAKDVDQFSVYLMDYGAPIGLRLFENDPERVQGFIIQNGNAYDEGLSAFWDPIRAYWQTGGEEERNALRGFLEIGGTEWQYTHGQPNPELISPDTWHTDQYLLDRPGNKEIQLDLFYDYRTNLERYEGWQRLFRTHQVPALIVWGQNDAIFPAEGAHPYRRDLENVEFHLLDGGHFALESHGDFIAKEINDFLDREVR